jgi:excisionase family DNA binding protein
MDYLSIKEAAQYLHVHVNTLRNWQKKGLINPEKTPGGHRRFAKSELCKIFNRPFNLVRDVQFTTRQLIGKTIGG